MNHNKALWEKGDFTKIAAFMRQSGEALIDSIGIQPAMQVLDLGCGDGTTAVPAAQLGARVLGVDIAENLVAAGRQRAAQANLSQLIFQEGDACDLTGIKDNTFDFTVSIFGAMFAPKPFEVAGEMVRVTKKGGRIVMGNWIPGDPSFVSQVLRISADFTPAPEEGFISPMTWGVEQHIHERFAKAGVAAEQITLKKAPYNFIAPHTSPEAFIDVFRLYYGPTINAFAAAQASGKADLLREQLIALARAHNLNTTGGTEIQSTFLQVTILL